MHPSGHLFPTGIADGGKDPRTPRWLPVQQRATVFGQLIVVTSVSRPSTPPSMRSPDLTAPTPAGVPV
jgi:hypothetical protein